MISRMDLIKKILDLKESDKSIDILIHFFLHGKGKNKIYYNHLEDFSELKRISNKKIPNYTNNIEYLKDFINIKGYNLMTIKNEAYLYKDNDYIKPILIYDSKRIENSLSALAISI